MENMIKKDDALFLIYGNEAVSKEFSERMAMFPSCDFNISNSYAYWNMAEGYFRGAECIFKKCEESKGHYSIIDSLVYPMCFLYRHSIELIIKYWYYKYQITDDENVVEFMNKTHNLTELWNIVKPILAKRKKCVKTSVPIDAIEHYIKEFNGFDSTSYVMRYPIDKDCNPTKKLSKLDIYTLYERMHDFFLNVERFDYEIDNIVMIEKPKEVIMRFLEELSNTYDKLCEYILLAKELASNSENRDPIAEAMDQIIGGKRDAIFDFIHSLSWNQKVVFEVLYYVASDNKQYHQNAKRAAYQCLIECVCKMESPNVGPYEFDKEGDWESLGIYNKNPNTVIRLYDQILKILYVKIVEYRDSLGLETKPLPE